MNALAAPDRLLDDLAEAGLDSRWYSGVAEIPPDRGAYTLLIGLEAPLLPARPLGNSDLLAPGWYVYAGSARGPGGLAARLKRHFRKQKSLQWHVDHLTPHAAALAAQIVINGDECDLVDRLAASFAFDVALPRFGSGVRHGICCRGGFRHQAVCLWQRALQRGS